jgi:hypothetical protein
LHPEQLLLEGADGALGHSVALGLSNDARRSDDGEAWLWSSDFAEVCALAGVDAEYIRTRFYARQNAAA